MTWFDNTTYPPGSHGRIEPISWYLSMGDTGLSVRRAGAEWFMICGKLDMHDYRLLEATTAVKAQWEAIDVVRNMIRARIKATYDENEKTLWQERLKSLPRKKGGKRDE